MLSKVLCVDDDAVSNFISQLNIVKSSFAKEAITSVDPQEILRLLKSGGAVRLPADVFGFKYASFRWMGFPKQICFNGAKKPV